MNLGQKVALNTTVQVAEQAVGVLVSLLTLRITTGYLGVDEYGELAIIITVSGVLVAISDLGLATTLAREITKAPEDTDRLARQLLRFRVQSIVVLVLVMMAVIPVLPYTFQTKVGLAIYLVAVAGYSLASFPVAFFQAELKMHLQAAIDLLTRILALVLVTTVAVLDLGFFALVASLTAVGITAFVLAFVLLRRFWRPSLRRASDSGSRLARDAVSVGLVSVVGIASIRGGGILLSVLAPAQDVGMYSVAFRFVDQSMMLATPFVVSIFPVLTRLIHETSGRADRAINGGFQVLALGSIAITLGVLTLAPLIVGLIAGPGFGAAAQPARILAVSLPFLFCALYFGQICIAVNRQRTLIWVGIGSLVVNVVLDLLLIPAYTYNGAAVALVVSQLMACIGAYWLARRSVSFDFELGFLARLAIAVASAALVAGLVLKRSELAAFLAGELAFVAVAYLVGAVRSADVRLVLGRRRRYVEEV